LIKSLLGSSVSGDFFEELILSYQLIFGGCKAGRKHYRKHERSKLVDVDLYLDRICGSKTYTVKEGKRITRNSFSKRKDFRIFAGRLQILQHFIGEGKPRRLRWLVYDKSDPNLFYTFWAVIFFGSIRLILNITAVVLQGI
jgi:hypothetical protein